VLDGSRQAAVNSGTVERARTQFAASGEDEDAAAAASDAAAAAATRTARIWGLTSARHLHLLTHLAASSMCRVPRRNRVGERSHGEVSADKKIPGPPSTIESNGRGTSGKKKAHACIRAPSPRRFYKIVPAVTPRRLHGAVVPVHKQPGCEFDGIRSAERYRCSPRYWCHYDFPDCGDPNGIMGVWRNYSTRCRFGASPSRVVPWSTFTSTT
jgi:hypothetical protein